MASKCSIEFRDVSFTYVADAPVIKDVSFTCPGGQTLALVGATGGKNPNRKNDCSAGLTVQKARPDVAMVRQLCACLYCRQTDLCAATRACSAHFSYNLQC